MSTINAVPRPRPTPQSPLRQWVARHPVATFLIFAFTVSIAVAFIRLRTNSDVQSPFNQNIAGFFEHLFSLALPALLVVAAMRGKDGVIQLVRQSFGWRAGLRWYLIALLAIPIGSILFASIIYGRMPLQALVEKWPLLFTLIVPDLLMRFIFLNTIEEFGWLGFLQSRFQDQYGPWKACLLVEIPFGLWHLPGLIGDTGGQVTHALELMAVFAVFQLCGRFVNLWLYNNTRRSVLLAGLFHAGFNTTINTYAGQLIPIPAVPWFFIVSSFLAVMAVLLIVFTKGRLSYQRSVETQTPSIGSN